MTIADRPRHALRRLVPLVVPVLLAAVMIPAGPASADALQFPDGRGEPGTTPAGDILYYEYGISSYVVQFGIEVATPADGSDVPYEADVLMDLDGDARPDFTAHLKWPISPPEDAAVYDASGTFVCAVNGAWQSTTAWGTRDLGFNVDRNCLGRPARMTIQIRAWIAGGYDVAPDPVLRAYSAPVDDTLPPDSLRLASDVRRFWSPVFGNAHFYTADAAEALRVRTDANWVDEGPAFVALRPESDGWCQVGSPVHRFWSPVFRSHFYTMSAAEKDHIAAADHNWQYEGVAYCAYPDQQVGTVPLYRFWSPVFAKHFFTVDEAELQHIRQSDRNWTYEGVAAYVLPGV